MFGSNKEGIHGVGVARVSGGCRKTLHFYNKIREVLCEFVAGEELEQSGEQDSIEIYYKFTVNFESAKGQFSIIGSLPIHLLRIVESSIPTKSKLFQYGKDKL